MMGFFDVFKRSKSVELIHSQNAYSKQSDGPVAASKLTLHFGTSQLVQVAGTTTNSKEAAVALVRRHELGERVALYIPGTLQREPENTFDPQAIALLVEGDRIGYVPGYVAKELSLRVGASVTVPVQLFRADLGKGVRVEAFAWLGNDDPQWQYSTENPPAMTPAQKRMAAHESSSAMVQDAIAGGGTRAEQFKSGMVKGVHYLELVEPIKELKREGRILEALTLCEAAIKGAENSRDGRAPAPWYTEQSAIIHRKLGQKDQEIAVLKRWLSFVPPKDRDQTRLGQRLAKITG
ncbi:hypothetical protein [uncultured Salinibacterium sp.]|uniref:hypothetical protein n=1 Tax=uncultured Salinibacterium sp. TaxID=459274 RepID=UPI0030DBB10E|tara:strand:- start:70405 stop:71283 length:879 start_codon:yes stop_codon:yes gene_type:complete